MWIELSKYSKVVLIGAIYIRRLSFERTFTEVAAAVYMLLVCSLHCSLFGLVNRSEGWNRHYGRVPLKAASRLHSKRVGHCCQNEKVQLKAAAIEAVFSLWGWSIEGTAPNGPRGIWWRGLWGGKGRRGPGPPDISEAPHRLHESMHSGKAFDFWRTLLSYDAGRHVIFSCFYGSMIF